MQSNDSAVLLLHATKSLLKKSTDRLLLMYHCDLYVDLRGEHPETEAVSHLFKYHVGISSA